MNLQEQCDQITEIEKKIAAAYSTNLIKTPIHLCLGEEAVCVAVCSHLTREDLLFAYYRSHGWYIAKGGNIEKLWDELYGKETGCSGGVGGSMHFIDLDVGFHGTTAIVGAQLPHAVGAALAMKLQGKDHIVVCAFGDGASEQGVFMESLMFAVVHHLRVLFVCVNDGLATNIPIAVRQPYIAGPAERAQSMGILSMIMDAQKNNPNILDEIGDVIQSIRNYSRPYFIEFQVKRTCDHVGPNYVDHL